MTDVRAREGRFGLRGERIVAESVAGVGLTPLHDGVLCGCWCVRVRETNTNRSTERRQTANRNSFDRETERQTMSSLVRLYSERRGTTSAMPSCVCMYVHVCVSMCVLPVPWLPAVSAFSRATEECNEARWSAHNHSQSLCLSPLSNSVQTNTQKTQLQTFGSAPPVNRLITVANSVSNRLFLFVVEFLPSHLRVASECV